MRLLLTVFSLTFFALCSLAQTFDATFIGGFRNVSVDANHTTLWSNVTGTNNNSVLYRSLDQGVTWLPQRYQSDLTKNPLIYNVNTHPNRTGTIYFTTTQEGGFLWRSIDGGGTWTNPGAAFQGVDNSGLSVTNAKVLILPEPSHVVYVELGPRLFRSQDDGATFDAGRDTPCMQIFENILDPQKLVCHNTTNLFYSENSGQNFTQGAAPGGTLTTCTLVSSPQVNETYFGECLGGVSGTQQDLFFRSTNSFRNISNLTKPAGLPQFFVSPDHRIILAGGTGVLNLIRSRDLGQSWENTMAGNSTNRGTFGFDPLDSNIVYREGRNKSTNAGDTFTALNSKYVPLLAANQKIQVTLETGTAWVTDISLRDVLGTNFFLERLGPPIPSSATWFTRPIVDQAATNSLSAIGLGLGKYTTELQIGAVPLPVEMTVVARREPPAYFKVKRLTGLPSGRAIEPTTAGPMPGEGGPAVHAPVAIISGVAADPDGNIYMAYGTRIEKIAPDGTLTRYAGTGASGASSGTGGQAVNAVFRFIQDILWTPEGLLVYETVDGTLRRIRPNGVVEGILPPGIVSSSANAIARDSSGTIYLGFSGSVSRVQGNTLQQLFTISSIAPPVNGVNTPLRGMTIDPATNDFVIILPDRVIRRTQAGNVTTIAGTPGQLGFGGDGNPNATGTLLQGGFFAWVTADQSGNIYFSDSNRLRLIKPNGSIGTVAGDGRVETTIIDGTYATGLGVGTGYRATALPNGQILYADGTYLLRFEPASAPPSRFISPGGIVTITGHAKVSPGQIVSIYGVDLASNAVQAQTVPLPKILDGVSVQVNGIDVPLFYVSPILINTQFPYETAVGTAKVKVTRNGSATAEETVEVITSAPDVLVYDGNHTIAINANGQLNSATNPAAKGSFIVVYLSGNGPFSNPPPTGAAAVVDPLSRTVPVHLVTFTPASGQNINPVNTTAAFLGLTPTAVGLGQLNVEIPSNLPAGDYDVVLTVGGVASNSTRLSVGP
jgi:uncharacterized protein (TIGR03437 family)